MIPPQARIGRTKQTLAAIVTDILLIAAGWVSIDGATSNRVVSKCCGGFGAQSLSQRE